MNGAGLIFDFDGVVADSEMLANTVLAEAVSSHGLPTTAEEALARYMSKRWPDVIIAIEEGIGRQLPDDFLDKLEIATFDRFRTDLQEVRGASAFIRRFADTPKCIASSSSPNRLRLCLDVLGLIDEFGGNVFSTEMVKRGKPSPDIFFFAAERMNIPPSDCIVIEDSPGGVLGAVAAGMTVIGLHAASHIQAGHDQRLREAGAQYTAENWDEVSTVVSALLSPRQDLSLHHL